MGLDQPIDITADQRKTLLALLKRHLPNTTAWVYGSRVKWTARPQSDLDLVVFATPEPKRQVSELREAFEESNLPFRIDLFIWDAVPEQFRKQIEAEHVVLVVEEKQSGDGEWVRRKIGVLGRVVTGKTPSTAEKSNFDGNYPFITIPDLDGRVLIYNTERTLSDKGAAVLRTSLLPPGAVLMSCIATVGRCGVTTQPSFTNQQINSVIPGGGMDSRFLYYVFTQLGHELESTGGGGSVYTNVSKSRFSDIEVLIPVDLAEQRAIAHVLSTLDDKIELNRRMNETLEAMARALFKSWFVDFDPVRAKMTGRDPGLPQDLADLFPDHLVDSELGLIPEEWEVSEIGQIADVIDCLHSKKPERQAQGKPLLQLWNIRDDGLLDMADTYFIDNHDYEQCVSRMESVAGDCMITNVGRVGAVAQVPVGLKAALGRNMTGIRCKKSSFFPTFLIECLLSQAMRNEISLKMDTGTILEALNVRNIPKLRFVTGTGKILSSFEKRIRPLRARMEQNFLESRTLAALRDTLLPKLISGEIRAAS